MGHYRFKEAAYSLYHYLNVLKRMREEGHRIFEEFDSVGMYIVMHNDEAMATKVEDGKKVEYPYIPYAFTLRIKFSDPEDAMAFKLKYGSDVDYIYKQVYLMNEHYQAEYIREITDEIMREHKQRGQ